MLADIDAAAAWYARRRRKNRAAAKSLRVVVLLLAVAGLAYPLVAPAFDIDLRWGYLAFAVAAFLGLFDRAMGFSDSWIRFTVTTMTLEKLAQETALAFSSFPTGQMPPREQIEKASAQMWTILEQETQDWATEQQTVVEHFLGALRP